jgi:hypothetical protein
MSRETVLYSYKLFLRIYYGITIRIKNRTVTLSFLVFLLFLLTRFPAHLSLISLAHRFQRRDEQGNGSSGSVLRIPHHFLPLNYSYLNYLTLTLN